MIPHNKPTLGKEEELAALRVIRSGWLAQGEEVRKLEDDFCQFLGLPSGHAVAVSSGTAALYLALWALDAKDKYVAYPVYSCAALRNACNMIGAFHIPLDIGENSPNIDLELLKDCKAEIVIIPHMFGFPVNINILEESKFLVIEDCAQAVGAVTGGIKVGLLGDIAIFSFYVTKLITTGGYGGMVVSKNIEIVNKIRDYRQFDYRNDEKARFNFQMGDIQASIGRVQLSKLDTFLKRREEIFNFYKNQGLEMLDVSYNTNEKIRPVRYRAILFADNPRKVIQHLAQRGISAIVPIEDWELLSREHNKFPNALKLTKKTVSLPIYPSLTDDEICRIVEGVKSL